MVSKEESEIPELKHSTNYLLFINESVIYYPCNSMKSLRFLPGKVTIYKLLINQLPVRLQCGHTPLKVKYKMVKFNLNKHCCY